MVPRPQQDPYAIGGDPTIGLGAFTDARFFPDNFGFPIATGKQTLTLQRDYYVLVRFPFPIRPKKLAVWVDTAVAGSGKLALWSVGWNFAFGGQVAAGTFDPGTTGLQELSLTPPNSYARWFWFGFWSDVAAVLRGAAPLFPALPNWGGITATGGIGCAGLVKTGVATVGAALPAAPAPNSGLGTTTLVVPALTASLA
jgi:hypothetical protein